MQSEEINESMDEQHQISLKIYVSKLNCCHQIDIGKTKVEERAQCHFKPHKYQVNSLFINVLTNQGDCILGTEECHKKTRSTKLEHYQ